MISQLLSLLANHPTFEVYLVNWKSPFSLKETQPTPHDVSQPTAHSQLHCAPLHGWNKIQTLSKCDGLIYPAGGLAPSPDVHRHHAPASPQPHPAPVSIACLTWHIITVEIFVYFVPVPQPAMRRGCQGFRSSRCWHPIQSRWLKQDASFGPALQEITPWERRHPRQARTRVR